MEYRVRSVRLDDEVWEAVQKHELSANKLLRIALGLSGNSEGITLRTSTGREFQEFQNKYQRRPLDATGPLAQGRGKATTEDYVVPRGLREKGNKNR